MNGMTSRCTRDPTVWSHLANRAENVSCITAGVDKAHTHNTRCVLPAYHDTPTRKPKAQSAGNFPDSVEQSLSREVNSHSAS